MKFLITALLSSVVSFALSATLFADKPKPTIVELINMLKADSLRHGGGKWIQTWVKGEQGKSTSLVDIKNGYASFEAEIYSEGITGTITESHTFAVYYPESGGAVLAYAQNKSWPASRSNLKFFQLKHEELAEIPSLLPEFSCRTVASEETLRDFYGRPEISKLKGEPVLAMYTLPRKGTSITADCRHVSLTPEAYKSVEDSAGPMAISSIETTMDFPFRISFDWNKKKGNFTKGKRLRIPD